MVLSVKKATWAADGAATQAIIGVGFTPKAIIVWTTRQTAAGFAANAIISIGYGTRRGGATQNMSIGTIDIDAVSTTDSGCGRNDTKLLMVPLAAGGTPPSMTVDYTVNLDSFDADGFTVTYSSGANANGDIFHYIAFGGADITDANVVDLDIPIAGTSVSKTGVGFQPDILFCLASILNIATGAPTTIHRRSCFGVAQSATKFWVVNTFADDGIAMTTAMDWTRVIRTDGCLHTFTVAGAQDSLCDLDSFDADGFTLGILDLPAAEYKALFLCIKGGQWDVGVRQKPASTTDTLTGLAFQPKGVLFGTTNQTVTNTIGVHENMGLGGATSIDGTQEGFAGGVGTDAVLPTEEDRLHAVDRALEFITHGATPAESDEADLTALTTDGFTLIWLTAVNQSYYGWVAFADNVAGPAAGLYTQALTGAGI